ncbi:AAA family ATPase [Lactobacillus ultunensis]
MYPNISVELFNRNERILVIDVDPQFNLHQHFGLDLNSKVTLI